jgi:hypothetical protein
VAFTRRPGGGFAQTSLPPARADGWISLLNGRDLTGWYTILQKSGKDVAQARKIVVMEQEMLHILGNEVTSEPGEPGYIATNQEFENVHIRVEYEWGVKRFAPRSETKRDNGILYGLVGEDKVWPRMVECQIEDGDVGDYFLVDGVRGIQARHDNGLFGQGLTPNGWSDAATTRPGEAPPEPTTGRKIKFWHPERSRGICSSAAPSWICFSRQRSAVETCAVFTHQTLFY